MMKRGPDSLEGEMERWKQGLFFLLQIDLLLVDGCMTTFRNVSTSSLPKKRSVFHFFSQNWLANQDVLPPFSTLASAVVDLMK